MPPFYRSEQMPPFKWSIWCPPFIGTSKCHLLNDRTDGPLLKEWADSPAAGKWPAPGGETHESAATPSPPTPASTAAAPPYHTSTRNLGQMKDDNTGYSTFKKIPWILPKVLPNYTSNVFTKYLYFSDAFKGTVSWDRFQKFWRKFKELDLTKGRDWCLNFLEAPMIL